MSTKKATPKAIHSASDLLAFIQETEATSVDLRFTDTLGKEHHVTIPTHCIDQDFLENGKMFDGSSIAGWKQINESDMILMPDASSAVLDPFYEEPTINLRCNIVEPMTMQGYNRDPRSLAQRAEAYLATTGIGDSFLIGPEPEFFIFDSVEFKSDISGAMYRVDSKEADWNSAREYEYGNSGHRPRVKGGYFPVPPVDSSQDIRAEMCRVMADMGLIIEAHHHEVATANQNEIATGARSLVRKADEVQIYKYVVHNVAHQHGKTATFMPKPLVGDNGSGMHCHQSISKKGVNIFSGDAYAGLSETALYYIGGIIHHAKALNAFTNPGTNSYKRLVPGFEAPVLLAYSGRNRSASIRIPFSNSPKGRRIEVRFPDPTANPYLAFAAMLMAGLDGIKRKMHPGEPMDKDLYDLPPEELSDIPSVSSSLSESLGELDRNREFLLQGDVFTNDMIDAYIELKHQEIEKLNMTPHPVEFLMYYSL